TAHGFPVWVGGRAAQVREIVAVADGWNAWDTTPDRFEKQVALVRDISPAATITWGGLARPKDEGVDGLADRLRPYVEIGAEWLIIGPVDSSNPDNAARLGDLRAALRQHE